MSQPAQNNHTAGCAALTNVTPEAIKAMSWNDIAILATQRADISSADCIQAVTELAFSGRTWRKDWQRSTLLQSFADSAYFQANPTHRDKTIDALVAMRAEAESAAGGGTQPPPASGTVPHATSTAAHAAAGQRCADSVTLTPETIKAMSSNDILPSSALPAAPVSSACDSDMDPDLMQAIRNSLAPLDDVTFSKRVPDLAVRTVLSGSCKIVVLFDSLSYLVIAFADSSVT